MRLLILPLLVLLQACAQTPRARGELPSQLEIDTTVHRMMLHTGALGFSLAVIDEGEVVRLQTYGQRDASAAPLDHHIILHAAQLTQPAFAHLVLQLVDEGLIDLDRPIADYLSQPAPEHSGGEFTPRRLLDHSAGLTDPDDGFLLLQHVLEEGLGLDVGQQMRMRLFEPLGMPDTSLTWRDDFAGRAADGWNLLGDFETHHDRRVPRAADSIDSTIGDMAQLAAALVRGELLTPASRQTLHAGLGVHVFDGPQGRGFFKVGRNATTSNLLVCLHNRQRCVVILGNDLRAEAAIPDLVEYVLGPVGLP